MSLLDKVLNGIVDHVDERREKESDIEENNRFAKDIIYDAEESLSNEKEYLERSFDWLNDEIENHNDTRKEVAKKLETDVSPTMKAFIDFKIDTKISAPTITVSSISAPSIRNSHSFFAADFMYDPRSPGISNSGSLDSRWEKSKENLRAAQAYRDKVERAVAKMDAIYDRNKRTISVLEEDRKILTSLSQKVEDICSQLTSAMRSSSFTQEQADTLNGMYQIAKLIIAHIQTECLTGSCSIPDNFQSQHATLVALNREIPDKPNLKDTSKMNSILRGMLKT